MMNTRVNDTMYAIIDFTDDAKNYCTFDTWNLKIFIYDDDGTLINDMDYCDFNVKTLKEMNIPVIFKPDVRGCNVPKELRLLATMPYD